MVKVAKRFVSKELESAIQIAVGEKVELLKMNEGNDAVIDYQKIREEVIAEDIEASDVKNWFEAYGRVMNNDTRPKWRFHLIKSDIDNAFVSELSPQQIFVTTGMINKYISNDDELALIFGHELSHLILGHSSEKNTVDMMFRTVEILLLSVDPTEGFLSMVLMGFIVAARKALYAEFSKIEERQADEMGIHLAAIACYDTESAISVFNKMNIEVEEYMKNSSEATKIVDDIFSSHPLTSERYEFLKNASSTENPKKYSTECGTIAKRFKDMILLKKTNDNKRSP
eukprot:CAMPEP_0194383108 /NCGR_PEP_ID=MMETSP0174-20130528/65184_1 /TAXON_ID=216777 /ORGANISM="Proboscia alata, Strain PI-D3" /LENGTH=284 /DNA_ID=CAMNT_0039169031 /DNA_START=697 /DNA_END=1551 /DNA_ORIENTATION=+